MREIGQVKLAVFFILFIVVESAAAVIQGENILLNGRFEADQRDIPPFWSPDKVELLECHPSGGPQPGTGYISLRLGNDGGTSSTSIRQAGHKLVEGGRYRLSAYVRTRGFNAASAGIAIASAGWLKDARVGNIPGDTGGEWKRLERSFVCFEGQSYFAVLFASKASGVFDIADVRLEAVDEKAIRETVPPELSRLQTSPRLIPFAPLLEKIPEDDRRVVFRFFGKLPAGTEMADCDVVLSTDDAPGTVGVKLTDGDIEMVLPDGGKDGILRARIVSRADGVKISEDRYRYRVEKRRHVSTTGHRRLNNLATEVLAVESCESESRNYEFYTTKDGWVFISAKGNCHEGGGVSVDGRVVVAAATPRMETVRRLRAGKHDLAVSGIDNAKIVVRQIAEIISYCPGPSWIPENGGFDWDFQEKYVLPGITTMNGAGVHRNGTRERGFEWIGHLDANWNSVEEMISMLLNCPDGNNASLDGVSCDEFVFADSSRIDICGRGLFEYEIRYPSEKRIMTWMVGKPSVPGIDHAFLASGVNVSRGNGALLFEAYCRTRGTEKEARGYIDSYIGDTMRRYRSWYPLAVPSTFVVLGNFTQAPVISLLHHPEVDYKHYLDMQMNYIANDLSCRGLGGVGYWGGYYADEETHRWSFELTRHYVFEGNTNMLSEKFGYSYRPSLIENGDFRSTFAPWSVTGDVRLARHENLGSIERRWGGNDGLGDTYALFAKHAGEVALVTQKIKGLVPGRMYRLEFLSFDSKDMVAGKVDPKPVGIRMERLEGARLDKRQCWSHVDRRTAGAVKNLPRVEINNVVFTAEQAELVLSLSNAAAKDGDELGVNFVRLNPYLPR